ncbi:SDR family NAD(P)-dependent oxidoreductase [Planococcus sp. FY231025]|uniref:SDR family NAD(P)-dependent oxidoreductase n=1 Tax=Planococcus sp. FY231025 TaxID=3455699 RepID=UPI003F92C256
MKSGKWLDAAMFPAIPCNLERLYKHLHGKTILITGASSGIGKELALLLADADVHLVLTARREVLLTDLQQEIAPKAAKVTVIPADLREDAGLEKVSAGLHALPEGLDVMVSNAGLSINRTIFQSLDRPHDFSRTMAINYFAPVRLLLSAIPLLEKNKGQIINVSTINALMTPMPDWAAYQASKAAFDTWLRSAAPELKQRGIAVSSVYLPLVRTPMIEPTRNYRNAPALTAPHAAGLIARTLYTQKRTVRPWWMLAAGAASVFVRHAPASAQGGNAHGRD